MHARLVLPVVALVVSLLGTLGTAVAVRPAAAQATPVVLTAVMTGAQEAPGPGDPDGFGVAVLVLLPEQQLICYTLVVVNIAPATSAHIHIAPPGEPGPVVVPLAPPTSGVSAGCTPARRAVIEAIAANPGAYYVNVHNEPYPAGAVRGQLSR
jgi:hypothetical protein